MTHYKRQLVGLVSVECFSPTAVDLNQRYGVSEDPGRFLLPEKQVGLASSLLLGRQLYVRIGNLLCYIYIYICFSSSAFALWPVSISRFSFSGRLSAFSLLLSHGRGNHYRGRRW